MHKQNIISYLLLFLLFSSCQDNKNEVNVNGFTINGISSFHKESIIYLYDNKGIVVDSSKINKKSFQFKGTISKSSNYYFKFKNKATKYPILLENENFITVIRENDNEVFGGHLNGMLRSYQSEIQKLTRDKTTFLEKSIAINKNNTKIKQKLLSFDENKNKLALAFISKNKNNLLAKIVLDENKGFSLDELLRIQQQSKNIENNSLKLALNTRIEVLQKIAEAKIAQEKAAIALKKAYRKPAIMFSGEGLDGEDIFLKDIIKGKKAVLIDFWASWCAPCRMVTPAVKRLHTKYKDKGFTILTVSEDKDKASWKKGIAEDNMLEWNHIYDDFSRISNMHGIKAIPYMVLIDGKGKVIKENISYTQLTKELAKICK